MQQRNIECKSIQSAVSSVSRSSSESMEREHRKRLLNECTERASREHRESMERAWREPRESMEGASREYQEREYQESIKRVSRESIERERESIKRGRETEWQRDMGRAAMSTGLSSSTEYCEVYLMNLARAWREYQGSIKREYRDRKRDREAARQSGSERWVEPCPQAYHHRLPSGVLLV